MKKILSIIGSFFLVLVLLIASFFLYASYQKRGLDASSKAYIEANVPPIVTGWSKDELVKRSTPQFVKIFNENPNQLDSFFKKFSKLGAMRSVDDVKGNVDVSVTTRDGKVIHALYLIYATFENGKSIITIQLIQSPSIQWEINSFNINSPIFLND